MKDIKDFFDVSLKQADQLWKNQKKPSYFTITGLWLRGFIEAEGSFFEKYPLQSRKVVGWFLWSKGLELIKEKQHLTDFGVTVFKEFNDKIVEYRLKLPID